MYAEDQGSTSEAVPVDRMSYQCKHEILNEGQEELLRELLTSQSRRREEVLGRKGRIHPTAHFNTAKRRRNDEGKTIKRLTGERQEREKRVTHICAPFIEARYSKETL